MPHAISCWSLFLLFKHKMLNKLKVKLTRSLFVSSCPLKSLHKHSLSTHTHTRCLFSSFFLGTNIFPFMPTHRLVCLFKLFMTSHFFFITTRLDSIRYEEDVFVDRVSDILTYKLIEFNIESYGYYEALSNMFGCLACVGCYVGYVNLFVRALPS